MSVAVVIPWRGGCPHREAALGWLTARLATEHPDFEVVVAEGGDGEWVKADAVAAGIARTDAGVLVVHDGDCWAPMLADAVERVDITGWAMPHGKVHRLNEAATAKVLAGDPLPTEGRGPHLAQQPYAGYAGGGVVALRRDVWDRVPLDRRFAGWGHEDSTWSTALTCLHGAPVRLCGPLWHLWHPTQPRRSRGKGARPSEALERRYQRAARDPVAMLELIEEGRRWTSPASST